MNVLRFASVRLPALLLLGVLASCSGLRSDEPPSQVYVLRSLAAQSSESSGDTLGALRVARPQAYPGLESERIILVQKDRRMNHFAASRWADDLPEVVEALVLETLRASGDWSSVFDSRSPFSGDYLLQITIRRFEADYTQSDNAPAVHVSLVCSLGRRSDREVLATFDAEGSATAAANRLSSVVAAFEQAANAATAVIAERTRQAVRRSKGPSSP
ncbi:MAG TPA: ABC-type transport auxiliary lipoprotein family protein [Steroidobacteraceae bacterium]